MLLFAILVMFPGGASFGKGAPESMPGDPEEVSEARDIVQVTSGPGSPSIPALARPSGDAPFGEAGVRLPNRRGPGRSFAQ